MGTEVRSSSAKALNDENNPLQNRLLLFLFAEEKDAGEAAGTKNCRNAENLESPRNYDAIEELGTEVQAENFALCLRTASRSLTQRDILRKVLRICPAVAPSRRIFARLQTLSRRRAGLRDVSQPYTKYVIDARSALA
jgi:hypothetical protein